MASRVEHLLKVQKGSIPASDARSALVPCLDEGTRGEFETGHFILRMIFPLSH